MGYYPSPAHFHNLINCNLIWLYGCFLASMVSKVFKKQFTTFVWSWLTSYSQAASQTRRSLKSCNHKLSSNDRKGPSKNPGSWYSKLLPLEKNEMILFEQNHWCVDLQRWEQQKDVISASISTNTVNRVWDDNKAMWHWHEDTRDPVTVESTQLGGVRWIYTG